MYRSFEWDGIDGLPSTIDHVISHTETEDRHIVDNGYHEYEIMKSDISKWWIENVPGSDEEGREEYEKNSHGFKRYAEWNKKQDLLKRAKSVE